MRTAEHRMWCAQCGEALARRSDGAWSPCNTHAPVLGYWSDAKPLGGDLWAGEPFRVGGAYFYPGPRWPWLEKPALPAPCQTTTPADGG